MINENKITTSFLISKENKQWLEEQCLNMTKLINKLLDKEREK